MTTALSNATRCCHPTKTFLTAPAKSSCSEFTDIGPCMHAFTRTSGLPCKHFLYEHLTADPNWKLDPYNCHKHWFYIISKNNPIGETPENGAPALFQIRDLDTQLRRVTRRPGMPESSTQRSLTVAEIEDTRLANERRRLQQQQRGRGRTRPRPSSSRPRSTVGSRKLCSRVRHPYT